MAEQRVRASRGGGSDVRGQVVQTWGKARAVVHLTSSPLPHRSKALLNSDVLPYAPPPSPHRTRAPTSSTHPATAPWFRSDVPKPAPAGSWGGPSGRTPSTTLPLCGELSLTWTETKRGRCTGRGRAGFRAWYGSTSYRIHDRHVSPNCLANLLGTLHTDASRACWPKPQMSCPTYRCTTYCMTLARP